MTCVRVEHFLRKAVEEGKFGKDEEVVEVVFKDGKGEDQFAAAVVFATVKLREKSEDVVVKFQRDEDTRCKHMNTKQQFCNEVIMYGDILPFLEYNNIVRDVFPRCFYSHVTYDAKFEEDVIVLEDMRTSGFRLSSERLFLDLDHCVLCMKQLGRFHALSYLAKKHHREEFMNKVSKLKEVYYEEHKRDSTAEFLMPFIRRAILPLMQNIQYKEKLEKFLEELQDTFMYLKAIKSPVEPLAVLCHGDFCRNNVLFKYKNDKPIDVKFFDIATSLYCSPALDISFFFALNVPSSLRRRHWDDLVAVYYESMCKVAPVTDLPTLDSIKEDVLKKAGYGFVLCSFFIPILLLGSKYFDGPEELTLEETEELMKTPKGKEVMKAVMDIVEDLIFNQCL